MPYALANAIDFNDPDFDAKFAELCQATDLTEDSYQKFTEQLCRIYPAAESLIRKYRDKSISSTERRAQEPELLKLLAAAPETIEFDGCKGATALMKLEFLKKDSLEPNETTLFILKELRAIGGQVLIHKKEQLTIGCDRAAKARGIPPFQEMKSLFYEITLSSGKKEYIAFHLRGDEEADEETIKKIIQTNFPGSTYEKADVEKFGLSTGRVNPLSLKWVQEKAGIPILQCFSETLKKSANKDFPDELFTNIGSNYLGMTLPISSLPKLIENVRGISANFAKARGETERKSYSIQTVGFVGDAQNLFRSIITSAVQQQMAQELGASFPPILGSSLEGRSAFFCNFLANPRYYLKQIKAATTEQFAACAFGTNNSPESLICIGHNASLYLEESLTEAFRGTLLRIDQCTTDKVKQILESDPTKKVLVACSKNYAQHNLRQSAYTEIAGNPIPQLPAIVSTITKITAGATSLSQKELDSLQKELLDLASRESKSGKEPFILVIASAELGMAIKQLPTLGSSLQKAGCILVNSVDVLAEAICNTLYKDTLKEFQERKAASQQPSETTATRTKATKVFTEGLVQAQQSA